MFIPILYMFRAPLCSSSRESILLLRHLVYVTFMITIILPLSPDDEHRDAQKMYRIRINIYEKVLCVKLVIYKN